MKDGNLTFEHRKKISQAMKGRVKPLETIEKISKANYKSVIQYDMDMNVINKFVSYTDAAKYLGVGKGIMSKACLGKSKSLKNFIWKYQPWS